MNDQNQEMTNVLGGTKMDEITSAVMIILIFDKRGKLTSVALGIETGEIKNSGTS